MRKLLLSATALAALTAPVFAADLPSRRVEPAAPVVYAPVFTWTGFYVGLNAGMGFTNSNTTTFTPLAPALGPIYSFSSGHKDGFVGGAQAGYNWQMGSFVIGGEADIQYADLSKKHEYYPFYLSNGSSGNWFGTVRARVGFAMDRALIYATGGLAYGDIGGPGGFNSGSSTRAGWVVGGGVEYAFTNNWTAKLEGLYMNIDRGNKSGTYTDYAGLGGAGPGAIYAITQSKNNDVGIVRVGLNYKF